MTTLRRRINVLASVDPIRFAARLIAITATNPPSRITRIASRSASRRSDASGRWYIGPASERRVEVLVVPGQSPRIPLYCADPGGSRPGRRAADRVEQLDVVPTVLQPARVHARPAADVRHRAGGWGRYRREQVLNPRQLQPSLERRAQPARFVVPLGVVLLELNMRCHANRVWTRLPSPGRADRGATRGRSPCARAPRDTEPGPRTPSRNRGHLVGTRGTRSGVQGPHNLSKVSTPRPETLHTHPSPPISGSCVVAVGAHFGPQRRATLCTRSVRRGRRRTDLMHKDRSQRRVGPGPPGRSARKVSQPGRSAGQDGRISPRLEGSPSVHQGRAQQSQDVR